MTTIYVDNAATTKTSRTAIEAMLPYMDKIYGDMQRVSRMSLMSPTS